MSEHNCKNTTIEHNIGSDIYPDDDDVIEVSQHLETCEECKKSRFICDNLSCKTGKVTRTFGEWFDQTEGRWFL